MPHRPPTLPEPLEPRRLFAAAYPSNFEQYMVELINRGRANPAAEADRYDVALNEGVPADELISTAPKQPLAINPLLTDAARDHSTWMLDADTFSHTGAGGTNPGKRMSNAGYPFRAPYLWGENLAWRSYSGASVTTALVAQLHEDLFVDAGIAGRGHRTNLMNADFREIGSGFVSGRFSRFNAGMLTTDFATTAGDPFVTGVVYKDAVKDDDFYTPGEGFGAVTLTATRAADNATYTTTSWSSGGYSLRLPAGTYSVVASGAALAEPLISQVTIGNQNVKADFIPGVTPVMTTPPLPPKVETSPTAALTRAKRNRIVQRYYPFLVTYAGAQGIDTDSFDNYDVIVTGPGGYARLAVFNSAKPNPDANNVTAFYSVKGPGGSWDAAENGNFYTIQLRKKQVYDNTGEPVVATKLGTFGVSAPAAAASKAAPAVFAAAAPRPAAAAPFSTATMQERDDRVFA